MSDQLMTTPFKVLPNVCGFWKKDQLLNVDYDNQMFVREPHIQSISAIEIYREKNFSFSLECSMLICFSVGALAFETFMLDIELSYTGSGCGW